jgi:integrase
MATFKLRRSSIGERRWQWTVRLKGFPAQYGTCPTKECARECARAAEEQLRSGSTRSRVTLGELIAEYRSRYLPTIPDSANLYRRHLAFWEAELGEHYADALTPQLISTRKLRLASRTSRFGRPLSPASVNRYLTTLSSVYSWGMEPEIGLVERNPVRDVGRLKEPRGRVRWLTRPVDGPDAELPRLLEACTASESPYLLDVVLLLLSTGCRVNEIMQLRWSDVRLHEGGFAVTTERAKTEEPRFVALEGAGLDVIQRRMAASRKGSQFVFPGPGRNGAALFPRRAWCTALERAGIRDLRPHDLRHTLGSYLAMLGRSLPEIMQAFGHESESAALRYIHLADTHKRAVSAEVNRAISGWLGQS